MTRAQWYENYRIQRRNRKSISFDFSSALKEIYDISLDANDQVKYDLIKQYKNKVSHRLQREFDRLALKGQKQAKLLLHSLLAQDNPFIRMFLKEEYSE